MQQAGTSHNLLQLIENCKAVVHKEQNAVPIAAKPSQLAGLTMPPEAMPNDCLPLLVSAGYVIDGEEPELPSQWRASRQSAQDSCLVTGTALAFIPTPDKTCEYCPHGDGKMCRSHPHYQGPLPVGCT